MKATPRINEALERFGCLHTCEHTEFFELTHLKPKRKITMTRRLFIDDEENDRDITDGVLQPAGHFRMPMFLRDGAPNPRLSPNQRANTAATRDTATFDAASHRPGHRYANDAAPLN